MLGDLAALDSDSALRRRLDYYVRPTLLAVDSCGVGSYVESLDFAIRIARLPTDSASSNST
jgi:hypothetical protein